MKAKEIISLVNEESLKSMGCELKEATNQQIYKALCTVVRDILIKERRKFSKDFKNKDGKQVYYMSMEFLVGTSLRNNLYNLGLEEDF